MTERAERRVARIGISWTDGQFCTGTSVLSDEASSEINKAYFEQVL